MTTAVQDRIQDRLKQEDALRAKDEVIKARDEKIYAMDRDMAEVKAEHQRALDL